MSLGRHKSCLSNTKSSLATAQIDSSCLGANEPLENILLAWKTPAMSKNGDPKGAYQYQQKYSAFRAEI
jgi:hypothetical protein